MLFSFPGKAFRAWIQEEKSIQAIVKGLYVSLFHIPPKTIPYLLQLNKFSVQMYTQYKSPLENLPDYPVVLRDPVSSSGDS